MLFNKDELINSIQQQFNIDEEAALKVLDIDEVLSADSNNYEQLKRLNNTYGSGQYRYKDLNDFTFNYFIIAFNTYCNVYLLN